MRTLLLIATVLLSACSTDDSYTLYRSSTMIQNARLHIATFDSVDGDSYNAGNCEQARELFQAQPGVATKFWCEKGRFRK